MARGLGRALRAARLITDPHYNARLGTEYLARMLDRFDGAYVLATAAYNAGPGRVDALAGARTATRARPASTR